jgi:hypothetical protein
MYGKREVVQKYALEFHPFFTWTLDGSAVSISHATPVLSLGKELWVTTEQGVGWA